MDAKSHNGLDALALIVAIALHVALIAALLLQGTTRQPLPEPKRITVNFAEEVGMTSTAPDPVQESQASVAPELGDAAPPPIEYVPPPPLRRPSRALRRAQPAVRSPGHRRARPRSRARSPSRGRPAARRPRRVRSRSRAPSRPDRAGAAWARTSSTGGASRRPPARRVPLLRPSGPVSVRRSLQQSRDSCARTGPRRRG